MSIEVRTITADQHLAFINERGSASFLQTPAWADVKSEWRGEFIGFFDGATLTGVGLILYRQLPKLKRYLAYLPEVRSSTGRARTSPTTCWLSRRTPSAPRPSPCGSAPG